MGAGLASTRSRGGQAWLWLEVEELAWRMSMGGQAWLRPEVELA